jgi:hypothetical protein
MNYTDIFPKNNKILIIGPFPPPIGGVSTFLKRYVCHNINYYRRVYHGNKIKKIKDLVYLLTCPLKINLFINEKNIYVFLILLMRFFPSHIIYYDHNFPLKLGIKTRVFKLFLYKANEIWVVNHNIKNNFEINFKINRNKIFVKCPFIAPNLNDENQILRSYPVSIFHFINTFSPILLVNAWRYSKIKGIDLYGIDLCIRLIERLKENGYTNVGLILAIPDFNSDEMIKDNDGRAILTALKTNNNLFLLSGQRELWPLFKKIDVFLRPTCTDGDALSIRESLYFNKPVIASDVTIRPNGVNLFRNRNFDDFELKTINVLRKLKKL